MTDTNPPALSDVVTIGSMSPEWLTDVLRRADVIAEAGIVAVEREPVGAGQVGDTYRLTPVYDRVDHHGPSTVIAKVSAADPESRAAAAMHHLYEREVRFYEVVAPLVGIRVPRCLYSAIDLDTGTFVLLLEDLAPLRVVDQITGMTVGEAEVGLAELAKLHAPVWNDPDIIELDWLNYGRGQREQMAGFASVLFDTFLERYGAVLEPDVDRVIRAFRDLAGPFGQREHHSLTVIHGDYRADNMLFDAHDGADPLVVVDWQTTAAGPGLLDVAYLLGTGLDVDARETHEERLVRDYHAAITAAGVTGYDWEQCWEDYRLNAAYAVLMLVTAAVVVERTERGDAMFLSMLRRAAAQIVHLDTESLITN